jgi:hypothetical protein
MKVKAPFHVGEDFDHDWILFALRVELSYVDETVWDYFQCQRLATLAQRLALRSGFEKWLSRRKFVRRWRVAGQRQPLPKDG